MSSSSKSNLRFDPEFAAAIHPRTSLRLRGDFTPATISEARDHVNEVFGAPLAYLPALPGVKKTVLHFPTLDGTTTLEMHRYDPAPLPDSPPSTDPQPAILFAYGGGMFAGNLDLWSPTYPLYATMAQRPLFIPTYRQPPDHKYPVPVDDVYAALKHLLSPAESSAQNIDPSRLALFGASAGALLAASVALRAKDDSSLNNGGGDGGSGGWAPALLILDMPPLDDRTAQPENWKDDNPANPFLTWNAELTRLMWDVYLTEDQKKNGVPVEAAPARATKEQLVGMPSTWICVGGLDVFAGEVAGFAQKLIQAGVEVELRITAGLPHAGGMFAPLTSKVQEGNEALAKALRSF